MFKKKLDLVIDVESIDIYAPCFNMDNWTKSIFNIGATGIERISRDVILSRQIGIEKSWSVSKKFIRDFYRKNFKVTDFDRMFLTFADFTEWFNSAIVSLSYKYDIQLWSYNAMFDQSAFYLNAERENSVLHKLCKDWKCIMMGATRFLADPSTSVQFSNWTVQEGYKHLQNNEKMLEFITSKGNIRTTAQHVYRFITQNVEFIELHKGLEDTQCEVEILKWVQGHKGWTKVDMAPGVGWKIANPGFKVRQEGHLQSSQSLLTWENLERLNEMMKKLSPSETSHKENVSISEEGK